MRVGSHIPPSMVQRVGNLGPKTNEIQESLQQAGASQEVVDAIGKADLDGDGVIQGSRETRALKDALERTGNINDLEYLLSKAEEANRRRSERQARPSRGLQGGGGGGNGGGGGGGEGAASGTPSGRAANGANQGAQANEGGQGNEGARADRGNGASGTNGAEDSENASDPSVNPSDIAQRNDGATPNGEARITSTRNAGARNQMVSGQITVNGNTYNFRSGGHARGSLPPGDYTVSNPRRRGENSMSVGGVGYSFDLSDKYDSRVGGTRSALRIHPDGGSAGTAGCIGIVGGADVQRRFEADMRAELARNGGRYRLRVS